MKHFAHSGFFAWRTPLLPFDELLDWGDGLQAPAAIDDPKRLEEALARDRLRLRDRLSEVFSRPAVREALFIAAPELEEFLELWMREPESRRGQRVELALARYFQRMTGRATPFGLFAGCSVGKIAEQTRLRLDGQAECGRHTRLDMDYLSTLTESITGDPALKNDLVYFPNNSLYRAAGRVRYVESRLRDRYRTHHLVAADDTDFLATTLARATEGARPAELAAALTCDDISEAEAEAYIAELIESQILVPELELPVTGPEPTHILIGQLSGHQTSTQAADCLMRASVELAGLDAAGLGNEPARYRALARDLENLPAQVELPRLFQVDLVRSAPEATLGGAVLDEINRGIDVIHRLFGRLRAGDLGRFCESFVARYEEREVPLVEALDEEIGIGYPPGGAASDEVTPLLRDLAFPATPAETTNWSRLDALLLEKLTRALASQAHEISLEPKDLETIGARELPPLPDAFAVVAAIAAADETAMAEGDFRLQLRVVSGPSGASLLGRFCHADQTLQHQVEQHLRAEEMLRPDAVFAEIVHLPQGRLGNILQRPVLRDYEIPWLGRSGAAPERQIPITDLLVSVRQGRIRLRSRRLGREVIPRLTSAHAFHNSSSGLYRFLGTLQFQDVAAGLAWDWGVLATAPFLPRVVMGRLVLSLASWRVSREEIERLRASEGATRYQTVQQWRAERRLPRWVALADGDNLLPTDLDNALSVETLIHLLRQRERAELVELFPEPGELCARGPEGRFVHELIVPYVRTAERARPSADALSNGDAIAQPPDGLSAGRRHRPPVRRFPPGSEWVYARLYTGTAMADLILRELIRPLTEELMHSGAIDRWFFIRYGDPDWHLRLRLHGTPERLHREALPLLQTAAAQYLAGGELWRLQLDTYEREVERYGGARGIELAEELFYVDSEAVLEILELLEPGDAGLDERWRLVLRGMDLLLDDFGFDLSARHALLAELRKAYAREFRADEEFIGRLGDRFRQERKDLVALLDPDQEAGNPLRPGIEVLRRRSQKWAATMAQLRAAAGAGQLSLPLTELAASFLHMQSNRLLRSAPRAQEMVIYDYLARLYESRLARTIRTAPALCLKRI